MKGLDVVKYLIDEQQVNPSCRAMAGRTPLHGAVIAGQLEVVKYLVTEKHCNPMCENDDGVTPFDGAIRHGHLELSKFFSEGMLKNIPSVNSVYLFANYTCEPIYSNETAPCKSLRLIQVGLAQLQFSLIPKS